jgi:hypothetical protein
MLGPFACARLSSKLVDCTSPSVRPRLHAAFASISTTLRPLQPRQIVKHSCPPWQATGLAIPAPTDRRSTRRRPLPCEPFPALLSCFRHGPLRTAPVTVTVTATATATAPACTTTKATSTLGPPRRPPHLQPLPLAPRLPLRTGALATLLKQVRQSGEQSALNHPRTRELTMSSSPTEQRPPPTPSAPRDPAVRVCQEPTLRRQQPSKADPALHYSTPSSGAPIAPHSTGQVRQDSAIDQHRLEADNDTQSSTTHVSYFGQSQKGDQRPSPKLASYQSASSTPAYASIIAPLHSEDPPSRAGTGTHPPPRQHSKSLSSGSAYLAASSKPHEHSTERPIARNGTEPRANITGPSSLPEQFFTQQNNFGTRQQRYNVRFAANYTSENMPPSQKPRNGSPSPPVVPPVIAEPEQPTSSPVSVPVPASDELLAPSTKTNGSSRHTDAQPRPTREARDRSEREPSVERCVGCNEAWRRPIPDMDQGPLAPAENNADYMRLASNMIDRLRDQRKRADAAYEEWKWRHSHCYRPASPHSNGSVDDAARRADLLPQSDGSANGQTMNKRKSEAPHEPQSKQRRVTSTSPAPPVRKPDSS